MRPRAPTGLSCLDIEAAALGASESVLSETAPAEALHTFTLESGVSRCFFRNSTTLTPLYAPIPARLADPSGGPVLARSSTVLPCPALPSGSLSSLHLPLFSANLVSTAALQDAMVTTTTPGGRRVSVCTCTRTGRHLATITRWPGSTLYTLATEPPHVAASGQVSASGQVAPPCSCRLLSHQTLRWHHRPGHPSLPRLRGMHSRLLVSGLPWSLPPLMPSPAPPCLSCVEGRQRAALHSSSFPPTSAPLQTLHMEVYGLACIGGHGHERYFLLVVDDYTRYTTVFPLCSKDLPILRLHSDRGAEFSSDLLRDFCREKGILQLFTFPYSPQQKGIAERRIGLVMEVAHTSMIHAAAPHFLWPFVVRYAAHQLNLWPFLPPHLAPCLPHSGGHVPLQWTTSPPRAVISGVDPLLCTAPIEVAIGSCAARARSQLNPIDGLDDTLRDIQGTLAVLTKSVLIPLSTNSDPRIGAGPYTNSAASGGEEPGGAESEGAGSRGAEPGGAKPWGAEPGGVEPRGAEPEGVEPGGAEFEGAEYGGGELRGIASSGGPVGASPRLSPVGCKFTLHDILPSVCTSMHVRTHLRVNGMFVCLFAFAIFT
ncbi:unnamed protein product [Closterium sp. NIES-53]